MMFGAFAMLPLLGIGLPVFVILLFIAGMLQKESKPADVGAGVFVMLLQTIGLVLMSVAGIPVLYSMLMRQGLGAGIYISLLLTFALGGAVYLLSERSKATISSAANVPMSIAHVLWKTTGVLAVLASTLSCLSQILIIGPETALWSLPTHLTMFFYGVLLLWCTREPKAKKGWFFGRKGKKK